MQEIPATILAATNQVKVQAITSHEDFLSSSTCFSDILNQETYNADDFLSAENFTGVPSHSHEYIAPSPQASTEESTYAEMSFAAPEPPMRETTSSSETSEYISTTEQENIQVNNTEEYTAPPATSEQNAPNASTSEQNSGSREEIHGEKETQNTVTSDKEDENHSTEKNIAAQESENPVKQLNQAKEELDEQGSEKSSEKTKAQLTQHLDDKNKIKHDKQTKNDEIIEAEIDAIATEIESKEIDNTDKTEAAQGKNTEKIADDMELSAMKEITIDLESFLSMREKLLESGLAQEEINSLQEKISSSKGFTWEELVTTLADKIDDFSQNIELDSRQQQKITTLFQKLGLSQEKASSLAEALSGLSAKDIDVALDEFVKALPADKQAEFLASIKEVYNTSKQTAEDAPSLIRVIGEAMENAQDKAKRMQHETADSTQGKKNIQQDKKLAIHSTKQEATAETEKTARTQVIEIEDSEASIADNSKEISKEIPVKTSELNAADMQKKSATPAKILENSTASVSNMEETEQKTEFATQQETHVQKTNTEEQIKNTVEKSTDETLKNAVTGKQQNTESSLSQNEQHNNHAGQDKQAAQKETAWQDFIKSLALEDAQATETKHAETNKLFAEAANQLKNAATSSVGSSKTDIRTEAPKIIRQVEDAVLKNLNNGAKRLTLQLTPENLGTVNLAITVRKSEVSATLRADNLETGKVLAEQLESIRQSLEDQGLKVSKLEVQTQLAGGDNGAWEGQAGQGKEFQQGMWQRLRQSMQSNAQGEYVMDDIENIENPATLSQQGDRLHLVA